MSEDVPVPRDTVVTLSRGHPGCPPTPAALQTEEGASLAVYEL
jgi:hypothetical protein